MSRLIPLTPQTRILRRRCHVGFVLEFHFNEHPSNAGGWRRLDRLSPEAKVLLNVVNLLIPLDEGQGDDPCIVEAGTDQARALASCCAPTARLYLWESDRAVIAERTRYGLEMVRELGWRVGDPQQAWMSAYRNVRRLACMVVTPAEMCAHAVEIVYVDDLKPRGVSPEAIREGHAGISCPRFEILPPVEAPARLTS